MHKCSSQPRPERWKPQEITAGSTPTKFQKKKKKREKQMRSQTRLQSASSLRLRREAAGKVHTRHNNSRDLKESESGEQACSRLWQVRLAGAHRQVDELGGANISLRKPNYSYRSPCHLEDKEWQKQEKRQKKKKTKPTDRESK